MRPLPLPLSVRPRRRLSRLAVGAAVALLAVAGTACSFLTEPSSSCSTNVQPGLIVTVRDSVTGAFIADSASGTVVSQANDWGDTLSVGYPGQTLEGAWERAGTFNLTVSRPGYNDWIASAIVVTKGSCHVNPVRLTALMQK